MDVENFFESIYEPKIYKVFIDLGYPKLLAFEMTRLCTRIVPRERGEDSGRTTRRYSDRGPKAYFPSYGEGGTAWLGRDGPPPSRREAMSANPGLELRLGSLPQGAPTSPLLANLAVRNLDDAIETIASEHQLTYTRYADDIALSTDHPDFNRGEASTVISKIVRAMEVEGLRPHRTKTRVVPPGARKIVLGLVVDGPVPRLTREYRNKLRLHAHILGTRQIAPSDHAKALGFRSVLSMRRHIEGKIAHAKRVEADFAEHIASQLKSVDWTL